MNNVAYAQVPQVAAEQRGHMSVREVIQQRFANLANAKGKHPHLTDEMRLTDSGLDSLSFAVIVAELEDELGFDPFNQAVEVSFPVTFGDFVRLYENHHP